jgi:hypothetical protein
METIENQTPSSRVRNIAGRHNRLAVYRINGIDDLPNGFPDIYSRMKHGDPRAVAECVVLIGCMILEYLSGVMALDEQIILTSSAYGSVPTASHAVMTGVAQFLQKTGLAVETVKINRAGDFSTTTYGSMSPQERAERMKTRKISLDSAVCQKMSGKRVLVIDDVCATGSHEKTLRGLLETVVTAETIYCYLVEFSEELARHNPETEECMNNASIKSLSDLSRIFEGYGMADKPVINARTIKFILSTEPVGSKDKAAMVAELNCFLSTQSDAVLMDLYDCAVSADDYFRNPVFIDGFHVLSSHIVARRLVPFRTLQDIKRTLVLYNVSVDSQSNLVDLENGKDLKEIGRRYSLMKFGSPNQISWFAGRITESFIASAGDSSGWLGRMLLESKEQGQHIALVSPGSRNVESAQNFLYEEAVRRINVWLGLQGLSTIVLVKLSRFGLGTANYSQLSAADRMREREVNIMPGEEFYAPGVHLIFADDVRITGAASDRTEVQSLTKGALSFSSLYCLVMDPKVAAANPGIEYFLNHFYLHESLNDVVQGVLNENGYRPVQRMVRLLLNKANRGQLPHFLPGVRTEPLVQIYESCLGNDYLQDERYSDSVLILKDELHARDLLDSKGLVRKDMS